MKKFIILIIFALPILLIAQDDIKWKAHDMNRPQPKIVTPPAQYLPILPPSDATILFDGTGLSLWEGTDGNPTKWISTKDYFECVKGSGYIQTKQGFGDVQLHIEWATPVPAEGTSQGRGNSGVFLMGRYEVQVLDSYENITYPDGQAGAVYGQYPPQVNVARKPGEWQSYDIIFHRPHFNSLGLLTKPARMTVFQNGVLIQDNVTLWGGTDWLKYREYEQHPNKLPLSLQDHGNPVRYRNVWIRELTDTPEKAPDYPPVVTLDPNTLEKYTGTYKSDNDSEFKIWIENGKPMLQVFGGRILELVIHSKEHFSVRTTAIDIYFNLNSEGEPTGLEYHFTGDITKAKKVK